MMPIIFEELNPSLILSLQRGLKKSLPLTREALRVAYNKATKKPIIASITPAINKFLRKPIVGASFL